MSEAVVQYLINLGLPGLAILAMSWWTLRREKDFKDSAEKRVEDWKKQSELGQQNAVALAQWVPANDARARAIDATVDAMKLLAAEVRSQRETMAAEVRAQRETMDSVHDAAVRAEQSNRELRETLIKMLERTRG